MVTAARGRTKSADSAAYMRMRRLFNLMAVGGGVLRSLTVGSLNSFVGERSTEKRERRG